MIAHVFLKSSMWMNVRKISIKIDVFLFIYKLQSNKLPQYLCTNIGYIYERHTTNTRNKNNIRLHNNIKPSAQNSLFYKG